MVKRYTRPEDVAPPAGAAAAPAAAAPIALPDWLLTPAQPETSADSLLRPSDPADGDGHPVRTGESLALRARALQRGTLVHRLLQSLPDIAAERRREAALEYLARNADGWTEEERAGAGGRRAGPDRGCAIRAGVRAPAAAPRSRSSAGWSGRAGRRRWFPGRSTGWW